MLLTSVNGIALAVGTFGLTSDYEFIGSFVSWLFSAGRTVSVCHVYVKIYLQPYYARCPSIECLVKVFTRSDTRSAVVSPHMALAGFPKLSSPRATLEEHGLPRPVFGAVVASFVHLLGGYLRSVKLLFVVEAPSNTVQSLLDTSGVLWLSQVSCGVLVFVRLSEFLQMAELHAWMKSGQFLCSGFLMGCKSRECRRPSTGRSSVEQPCIKYQRSHIQDIMAFAQFVQEPNRVRFGSVAPNTLSNFKSGASWTRFT